MAGHDFSSLVRASPDVLMRAVRSGVRPEASGLVGWEFRGWFAAGSLPALAMRKHRKGFYRLARRARIGGYNIPCHPGGPDVPWVDRLRGAGSYRMAWFLVVEDDRSLVLDYGREGGAGPLNPLRLVRERLVQVHEHDPDLLVSTLEVRAGRSLRQVGAAVYGRQGRSPVGI
jgi:hypothetical protein